jgi:hypothetical protein
MPLDPGLLFVQLLGGLSRAMILFLLSSGLSLTFGVMNILNFAHATLWLVGGYVTFSVFSFMALGLGESGMVLVLAILVGTALMVVLGYLIERVLIRRMYARELPEQLLLTFALILIFGDLIKLIWGVEDRSIYFPIEPLEMLDTFVNPYYFVVLAAGVGVAAGPTTSPSVRPSVRGRPLLVMGRPYPATTPRRLPARRLPTYLVNYAQLVPAYLPTSSSLPADYRHHGLLLLQLSTDPGSTNSLRR